MSEDGKPRRDLQGRWLKGVSGNPEGRPHKYAKVDTGELILFKNTVREVNTPEGKIIMTREAAVQHRLYQSAMQGNVHAQMFLARRFEKHLRDHAEILDKLFRLLAELKDEERLPNSYEETFLAAAKAFLDITGPNGALAPRKRRSRRKTEPGGGSPDSKP